MKANISFAFVLLLTVLAGIARVDALDAPLTAMPFSAIDGTIDAASGAERTGAAPADCRLMKIYALRNAMNLYLAVDVPEKVVDVDDVLLVYLDRNNNGGMNPDAMDLAIRLSDFPAGMNQTPGVSVQYPGTGAGWGASAAFATAKSSRNANRLVVELTVPITMAPTGFAVFYASKDLQDCDGDADFAETTEKWPIGLTVPGGDDQAGVKDPSQWDKLGIKAPVVTFNAPTCCTSGDITFEQTMVAMKQPFSVNDPVDIDAAVHNTDTSTAAKNVRVQITVHKFGTGGGVVFMPAVQEIMSIGPSAAATTGAVPQWTPTMPMHGCIRAEILAPVEGGGKSLDDYAVGANALVQYNTDVACAMKGMMKRLQFTKFNPSPDKAQMIDLVMRRRIPKGFEGLEFALEQPAGPLGPLQEAEVALIVRVPDNLPTTDLPRQTVHVPPTAGRENPVTVRTTAGERLHLSAAGTGGALIGSFDGFATSFQIGEDATLMVPQKTEGLRLAVAAIVDRQANNTGNGYDVDVWRMPAAPQQEAAGAAGAAATAVAPPFPEVEIFATTTEQITIAGKVYTVVRNVGGVVFQILVTEPGGTGGAPGGRLLWLLLLLLIILAIIVWLFKKKRPRTA